LGLLQNVENEIILLFNDAADDDDWQFEQSEEVIGEPKNEPLTDCYTVETVKCV
jgi:hypothetical protein